MAKSKSIIFYGTGYYASVNLSRWEQSGLVPVCFCDSDIQKHNKFFVGNSVNGIAERAYEILPLDVVLDKYPNYEIYVTAAVYKFKSVLEYLISKGIKKERIKHPYYDVKPKHRNILDKRLLANGEKVPLISVIISVYNAERYLRECLDSVVNQTLQNIEIICINDGSTDNSLNILKQYAEKDNRIRIINQKNKGNGIAKNIGIKKSKGEYIGFVDADDWIDLNFYECLYLCAKKNNADLARTLQLRHHDNDIKESYVNYIIYERLQKGELHCKNDHASGALTAIYRREFLIKNNIFFDITYTSSDKLFTVKAMFFAQKIVPAVETYYNHRDNVPLQMTTFNLRRLENASIADRNIVDFINSVEYVDSNDYVQAFNKIIHAANSYFRKAISEQSISKKAIKKFFVGMMYIYKQCKYKDELFKYNNEALSFLKRRAFEDYYAFHGGK